MKLDRQPCIKRSGWKSSFEWARCLWPCITRKKSSYKLLKSNQLCTYVKANLNSYLHVVYAQWRQMQYRWTVWSERPVQLAIWKQMRHILLHSPTQESASRRIKMTTPNNNHSTDQKEKKRDSDVATSVNYVVASFSSWFKSRCNSEMGITRITGAPKTIASSWKWTHWMGADKPYGTYLPRGETLGSHMLNYNVRFTLIPRMWFEWTKGGRVHEKQVLRRSAIQLLFRP